LHRRFEELSREEVLALAISVEEANSSRFATLADMYDGYDADLHALFTRLRDEELRHAHMLEREWQRRFGDGPRPAIRESDVEAVIEAVDLEHGEHAIFDDLSRVDALRLVERSEQAAYRFYQDAAAASDDPELEALYLELAAMEKRHVGALEQSQAEKPKGHGIQHD
jgi:rubrerythrin